MKNINYHYILTIIVGTLIFSGLTPKAEAEEPERMARVDLNGGSSQSPVEFQITKTIGSVKTMTNPTENGVVSHSLLFPASNSWQQGSITILPANSGMIGLVFLGPYIPIDPVSRELRPIFIEYDDVKSDTTLIKNGGFEESTAKESIADWIIQNIGSGNSATDDSNRASALERDAAEGQRYVRVWHNSRIIQRIFVEADVPTTITFMYRLGH